MLQSVILAGERLFSQISLTLIGWALFCAWFRILLSYLIVATPCKGNCLHKERKRITEFYDQSCWQQFQEEVKGSCAEARPVPAASLRSEPGRWGGAT